MEWAADDQVMVPELSKECKEMEKSTAGFTC
jgi:hypothetical protein